MLSPKREGISRSAVLFATGGLSIVEEARVSSPSTLPLWCSTPEPQGGGPELGSPSASRLTAARKLGLLA